MIHSTLKITSIRFPSAASPSSSYLPTPANPKYVACGITPDCSVPASLAARIDSLSSHNNIAYNKLDLYSRCVADVRHRVAVLENRWLRAVVLLDLGGRLWSLQRLDTGGELLFQPDRLMFTNQANCNAWFCGGIEWNIGVQGHSPLTCRRLAAGRAWLDNETPVLRLSEVERTRRTPFQIDLWLDPASPRLLSRIAIANPNAEPVPMYWWTNIAMAQDSGTRILAPADHAYVCHYEQKLSRKAISEIPEFSYPEQMSRAGDYFYEMPARRPPWIAAVNRNGSGLIQQSTPLLSGRKLFVWGQQQAGKRWHDWLGCDRRPYFEIQAGLATTQYEYVDMPAGARWEWLESYSPFDVDPALAHQPEIQAASGYLEAATNSLAEAQRLEAMLESSRAMADRPVTEVLQAGSGFAELEHIRLSGSGGAAAKLPGSFFALTQDDPTIIPWLQLNETGRFPASLRDWSLPFDWPVLTDRFWSEMLRHAIDLSNGKRTPVAALTYALIAFTQRRWDTAVRYASHALGTPADAHARRVIGLISLHRGKPDEAVRWLGESLETPGYPVRVLDEALGAAVEAGDLNALRSLWERASPQHLTHPRIRAYQVYDSAARNEFSEAISLLQDPAIVPTDQREGETRLTDLWLGLYGRTEVPDSLPPAHLDFRLTDTAQDTSHTELMAPATNGTTPRSAVAPANPEDQKRASNHR